MAKHTLLQQLMGNLAPTRKPAKRTPPPCDFEDTRPNEPGTTKFGPAPRRPPTGWAESSIELAQGTEIMEFPTDAAADLMVEYFPGAKKRA